MTSLGICCLNWCGLMMVRSMQFWSLSRQVFQLWSQNPFHFIRFNVTIQAITGPLTSFHRSVSGSVMVLVRFLLVNLNAFACFCERWVSLSWWASLILIAHSMKGREFAAYVGLTNLSCGSLISMVAGPPAAIVEVAALTILVVLPSILFGIPLTLAE